ncbi:type I DNA topoisomerase, partial [candidate division CSSED10-310 bacterium]
HIADLPQKALGVDVDHDFEPTYVLLPDKKKIIDEILAVARKADTIFLAPDPDREGEAIAWHLARYITASKKKIFRVMFHELTPQAVSQAFAQPGHIDTKKVSAQQARRILDRLVGYKVSPLLWRKVKSGLSAGRVQSVALRLICEREREIQAFIPVEYWILTAHLEAETPPCFTAKLVKYNDQKIELKNAAQADKIYRELKEEKDYRVSKVTSFQRQKKPSAPFITSTLQQDASRRFRFPAIKTMSLAQKLYEGKKLGPQGNIGLITYMRTDSVRISADFIEQIRSYIQQNLGSPYLPQKGQHYKNKMTAQDAHEAIRPTAIERTPQTIKPYLTDDEFKLYNLIWRRTVASQMKAALFAQTSVEIRAARYTFLARGSVMQFDGFLRVYVEEVDENRTQKGKSGPETKHLPPLTRGDPLQLLKLEKRQHFTQPPPRYTEASLIQALEKKGIGRPSTYASIMGKIRNHNYTHLEKNYFVPNELGFVVIDLLVHNFPALFSVDFTAAMEEKLDQIEAGRTEWRKTISNFYHPFVQELHHAFRNVKKIRLSPQKDEDLSETDPVCPKCGTPLILKSGTRGQFLACPGFPKCRYTASVSKKTTVVTPPDRDTKKPVLDETHTATNLNRGEASATLEIPCPQRGCSGSLRQRATKTGQLFYGCSHYPDCKMALWQQPIEIKCPRCRGNFAQFRKRKNLEQYTCIIPECQFQWSTT